MKNVLTKLLKSFFIGCAVLSSLLASGVILLLLITPVVNDMTALHAADSLASVPLPDDTEYLGKVSCAGKLTGCGNGAECFGAILLKSERSQEYLQEYYSERDKFCTVEPQHGLMIDVLEHRKLSFNADMSADSDYFIVYTWGKNNAVFKDIDIRGH